MRFDARDLTDYSEPVSAIDIELGATYYSVTFADTDMMVPVIVTIIFIGELASGNLRFQDAMSHQFGITPETVSEDNPATFYECAKDQLRSIFTFEKCLETLMRCSMRRNGGG